MPVNPSKVGELTLHKGFINDIQINLWDKVRQCTGSNCPYASMCPYERSTFDPADLKAKSTVCLIEQKYLTINLAPFMTLLERVNDPFIMQWVGMHLIPLYYDLCQLKMEKLLIQEIEYEDAGGRKRIHPIFEEIRRTHSEIFRIWRTTGLQRIAENAGFFKDGGSVIPVKDPELHGDGAEYDAMASGDVE